MRKKFDHIINATKDFCSQPRPTFNQKMQIQDLLLDYANKLPQNVVKSVCSILSVSNHVPKPVLIRFCQEPAHICHSILISVTSFSDHEFSEITSQSLSHARIVARNPNISPNLSLQLRALEDDKIHQTLDLRQRPITKLQLETIDDEVQVNEIVDEKFVELCAERSENLIYTAFADHLGLQLTSASILCRDFKSRNLPTAMYYIGLSTNTAWNLYRRLAGSKAYEDNVEKAFKTTYASLSKLECKAIVSEWMVDDLVAAARYGSAANDQMFSKMNIKKEA